MDYGNTLPHFCDGLLPLPFLDGCCCLLNCDSWLVEFLCRFLIGYRWLVEFLSRFLIGYCLSFRPSYLSSFSLSTAASSILIGWIFNSCPLLSWLMLIGYIYTPFPSPFLARPYWVSRIHISRCLYLGGLWRRKRIMSRGLLQRWRGWPRWVGRVILSNHSPTLASCCPSPSLS